MDQSIDELLALIEQESSLQEPYADTLALDSSDSKLDELMLIVGRESGQFLNFLVRALNCQRILDLGAGVGYSTIWLAEAARHTGGRVIAVEQNFSKATNAINHLANAGLLSVCDVRQSEALEFLASEPGPWDFALLDVWKGYYIPCFEALAGKVSPGGVIVADNMQVPQHLWEYAVAYQTFVRSRQNVLSIEVSIGNGLELTQYQL
jgi:predicted O-methyltransferase YrrM